jgi:hypothetical protein
MCINRTVRLDSTVSRRSAVKDVVAAGHRGLHRRVIEDVAVVVLDVEVLDRFRRAGLQISTRTSSPRSTSCLVTWEPRNPLAPITNLFAPAMG